MAKSLANRFGWLLVLGATLSMSDYSLYFVARHLGTPVLFAVLGGVIFDGAAILFADYSLKHARLGSSASGTRLAVLVCAGLSAYLNSMHAAIANQIPAARLFWAAPPVIAVAAYEAHIRYERRRALANAGRVAQDLPAMGKLAWLLFPVKTYKSARAIVRYRMGLLLARHTPGYVYAKSPFPVPGSEEIPAASEFVGETLPILPGSFPVVSATFRDQRQLLPGSTQHARNWLQARGYPVGERGAIPSNYLSIYHQALISASEPGTGPEPADDMNVTPIDRKVSGDDS
jgi:hypothetical protein